MIIVTLIFLSVSVLVTYNKLNSTSTRFMYGIIASWVVSFVSFVLYLSKFNYYYNIIDSVFNFSPGTWNYLVLAKFNPLLLIRLLNLGVMLFYCSLLGFAVSFTRSLSPGTQRRTYIVLAAGFAVSLVLYDPAVHIAVQNESLRYALALSNHVVHFAKYVMLVGAFTLMVHYYWKYPNIRFIKNMTLVHTLSLIPVALLHVMLFSWAPKNLVKATYLEGYYNYLQPTFGTHKLMLSIMPYVVYAALTFMLVIVYKYNSIETYRRNRDIQINKSIDTATLGTRAFTHALKNHLIAIQSEAEYLKDKHAGDEDTVYSLNLMLKSCEAGMGSINEAADKFKRIQLNLQAQPLEAPVRQALSLLEPRSATVEVRFIPESVPSPVAYIDAPHLSEAIYNLLKNAIESLAGQERGIVTVEIAQRNGWGMIRISDNGPGVPEELLDQIFNPFFTTKASVNNWGIGLSYCHKIVTGHDGKIQVESKVGAGTSFTIFLPVV
ncbi:Adaptive-response sensory-kinase SasA [Paenibacillus solanacearum]|uniref:Adaptive-response sensory-kinase SasA n=1 Tax=Paenibacillus solanacearum TaxID=2048548 RepID=A0A916JYQ9_9BACL|nr:HAMP domain-containing sensor histidine kinase [Paenibacillus solanacearum]CAG7607371.1 Adaptive-response sensory-kinase SasA [Paenibacillus solanacearum]